MSNSAARILLVEDHLDTAAVVVQLLQHSGYIVRTTEGITDTLKLLETEHFDLLICDLSLSDGDGCDLLDLITKDRAIRAIAFTACAYPEDIARSRKSGFRRHLIKPADWKDVLKAIREVMLEDG